MTSARSRVAVVDGPVDDIPHANPVGTEPPADGAGLAVGGGVNPEFPAALFQFEHEGFGPQAQRFPACEEPAVPGRAGLAGDGRAVADEGVVEVEGDAHVWVLGA